MSTAQLVDPQTGNGLTKRSLVAHERLRLAYEAVSPNLRPMATIAFCDFHKVSESTFRKKKRGETVVTEQEIEWMQNYRPY